MDYEETMRHAVRFIEESLTEPLDLTRVAAAVHLSPYHFHRVFSAWAGEPLMTYVRRRRLALAASRLMDPGASISDVALDVQFSSQATFTRAFQQAYGVTPGRYRRVRAPLPVNPPFVTCNPGGMAVTRMVEGSGFTFIGLRLRDLVSGEPNSPRIQALWREFLPRKGELGSARGAYGVCIPGQGETFTYMAAASVDPGEAVPPGMVRYTAEPTTYAVFPHDEGTPTYDETFCRIWATDLPATGREYKEGAPDLEVYSEPFQEVMQVEIWIPVV